MPARLLVAVAAVPAAAGAAWLALEGDREPSPVAAAVLAVAVGASFVGSGLVAWRERPENPLGRVLVFVGFAWFATFLADAQDPLVFTAGTALENVYLVGFVYLALTFPSGRLESRVDRLLVAAAVTLAVVVQVAFLLVAEPDAVFCSACPDNLLQVERSDAVAEAILATQRTAGIALSLLTVVLLALRWRRASPPLRRAAAPVLWAAAAMFAALALEIANDAAGEPLGPATTWTLWAVFAAFPVAVLAVLLQQRLDRAAVARLVVELGEPRAPDLREALARALGDPSLALAFWVPATGTYVDAEGRQVVLPGPDEPRTATQVERAGTPVAALVHDAALLQNPELVDSVCAAAALSLENERLQAELRARLADLQASRARLVEAAESERRRIERDLHDGTQQRLVSIAMDLGLAEARLRTEPAAAAPLLADARSSLLAALAELRELTHGIRPAALVEQGLGAALREIADRSPVPVTVESRIEGRLPAEVEAAAYFVASEAVANVAKHAHASGARLTAERAGGTLTLTVADDGIGGAAPGRGSGLRGLGDRVEALGGRLTLASPPGRGTTLTVELPCG